MIGDRIKKVLEHKGITPYKLAKDTGINKQTIINYIENKNIPSIDKMAKILACIGDNISTDWLLTGKGSMLKDKEISIHGNNNFTGYVGGNNMSGTNAGNTFNFSLPPQGFQKIIDSNGNVEIYQSDSDIIKELSELKNDITLLRREIEYLNEKVKLKDEIIETLRMTMERFHSNSIKK